MIYVMGGEYGSDDKKYFGLVNPSDKDRPYISHFADCGLAHNTQHHSHVYQLSDDNKSVTLVKANENILPENNSGNGVGAPKFVTLTEQQHKAVLKMIEWENFYDMM